MRQIKAASQMEVDRLQANSTPRRIMRGPRTIGEEGQAEESEYHVSAVAISELRPCAVVTGWSQMEGRGFPLAEPMTCAGRSGSRDTSIALSFDSTSTSMMF